MENKKLDLYLNSLHLEEGEKIRVKTYDEKGLMTDMVLDTNDIRSERVRQSKIFDYSVFHMSAEIYEEKPILVFYVQFVL